MNKTILVVDDDESVRQSVQKVLRNAGFEVVLAAGGLDAIARFDAQHVDLVLLDVGLPNQNGCETCRHLTHEHADVPIIVMTGQSGQFKYALAFGAAALVEKPLSADRLLQLIQDLLGKSRVADPYRSHATFYYIAPC